MKFVFTFDSKELKRMIEGFEYSEFKNLMFEKVKSGFKDES